MFPTSAGMIPIPRQRAVCLLCVPRKRGDDPGPHDWVDIGSMCSPQARG